MRSLGRYGYSKNVTLLATAIAEALEQSGPRAAERALAELALRLCSQVESGETSPKEADEVFTLLDLYLEDGRPNPLAPDAQELMMEGMSLHHLGEPAGADLSVIRELAHRLLGS